MKGSGLIGGRRRAALAVVSGSCLALTACTAASTAGTPGQQQAAIRPATVKFCRQIATAMKSLDSPSVTQGMSLKQARRLVDQLMTRGIASFTTLAAEAPPNMRATVLGVVSDFQAYQKTTDKASSVRQILAMVSRGTPAQQPAYEKLLRFTSDNC